MNCISSHSLPVSCEKGVYFRTVVDGKNILSPMGFFCLLFCCYHLDLPLGKSGFLPVSIKFLQ